VVPIGYPLHEASGAFAGVIGVSVDLEVFRPLASPAAVSGSQPDVYIVDAEGFVLAAGKGAALKVGNRHAPGLVAGLAAGPSPGWRIERDGVGQALHMHALAPVPGSAWFALAEADYRPIRAAIWRQGLLYGALSAAALLFGLWLARRIEQSIVDPIRSLAETVKTIAGGKSPARVVPGGAAELAEVGAEFNRILDVLAEERSRIRRREEELTAVLSSVDEVVYALSRDGAAMLYLSPGAERLYGGDVRYFAADPGRRHANVLEVDRPKLAAMGRQIEQAGQAEAEYRIRRGDGTLRWLRERCHLMHDGEGRPLRLAGIVSDVTPVRELVEWLKESEARFRSMAELSSDWYWEQDADFRFIKITGAPGGMSDASLNARKIGKCRWEMRASDLTQAQWAAHRARVERHEPFRGFEYGVEPEAGQGWVYVSVSGEPIFDAAGNLKGYRGVGSDITVRKRMEAALKESEARLQLVLQATSEGVWDYDAQADATYFSQRFAELLGCAGQAELKALFTFSEALHPDDRRRVLAAQDGALREGARFDETYRLRLKDGAYRWFHGRGIALRDADGRPLRFVGAIADVTARRDAEAQLRKLSTAIEQSPVSIVITDLRGDIEYVNPRFCQSTGYALEEALGCNPRLLKSGETPGAAYKRLWDTIRRGEEWSGELHNRRKNGELFWEFVRIIPLVSEAGSVTHFMAVKEDITLRKELDAREQMRQEQMLHHARLAAMGEMAAALAHELNQPLAAIANFSGVVEHQLAAPQPDLAQALEVARTIRGQALRAGDIVWRVREFSRKQESLREATDINALIGDVVRLADIAASSREVAYEYDLAPWLPPVPVDRVQIEQVLLNLIRNGVEAMEGVADEKRLLLASRLAEGGGAVHLSVSDRGCGLPDRIAMDLFTPFFTTKPEGMGMGLSISRGIVEAHGGRLWAAPNAGGGTTFHFTLPLQTGSE
jgi:PAS domain S-box-containing protein